MGYRSDIYIKARQSVKTDIYKMLLDADLLNSADMTEDDEYVYVIMYDLKWYDSYPDVQLVNNTIYALTPDATMLRIGEESEDCEWYSNNDLDMYYTTHTTVHNVGSTTPFDDSSIRESHPEYFI